MDAKIALRRELTARRAIAFGASPGAAAQLIDNFPSSILISDQTVVAGYMPFRTEIDVLPLMRALVGRGGQSVLPKVNSHSHLWGGVGVGGGVPDMNTALLTTTAPHPPAPSPQGGRGEALNFHICDPDNKAQFQKSRWGLIEPLPNLPVASPTILLVPLLGFDRQGNRIGYGKGYYDNAIASLRQTSNIIAIGVAFAQQEVPQIPTQPHDQRLDWIITQNGAYRFPS